MRTFIKALTLVLIIVASGGIVLPARAANGDLDRSFGGYGSGGLTFSESFPGTSIADSIATPDEQLIVVGSDGQDIIVVRYGASGKLDRGFGTNGITILDFNNQIDTASSVQMTFDAQKLLVAGTTSVSTPNADFAVARLNADGTPDISFGQNGKATLDFNGRADRATAVAEFVENKILVAGSVEQGLPGGQCPPTCKDIGLALLNSDGSLHSSFGNGGRSQHDFGGDETPLTVLLSSNTIYVGGYRLNGTTSEYLISLHQYGSGKLLPSFNGTGYRTGTIPPRATDLLAVGSFGDEDVVAIGDVEGDFGLLRFKEDGSPVTTWGNNGLVAVDFGADDSPHTLSYLPDSGGFAVAGESGARLALAHISDFGQLVPSSAVTVDLAGTGGAAVRALATVLVPDVRLWTIGAVQMGATLRLVLTRHFLAGPADAGGQQATNLGNSGLRNNEDRARVAVFQPDGKLLVAGETTPDGGDGPNTALVRYTTTGALDPSFDGDGRLFLASIPRGATGIALHDGKIAVAGSNFDVARLTLSGSADRSFNGSGKANFNFPSATSTRMIIQPDGKIVLAGYSSNPDIFLIARLTSSGTPDLSFGLDGTQRIGIGLAAAASAIAIQPDGKLIVAGYAVVSTTDIEFALVRLNTDGSLDPSFDSDGKLTTGFGGLDVATSLAIQPDGTILAAGTSSNNGAAFARYMPNGSLDPSFGSEGKVLLQITGTDWARDLIVAETGITAALCDQNEGRGVVLRLRLNGKPDASVNGNGRLPFRFGGQDCPLGLASQTGRIAAVGHTNLPTNDGFRQPPQDFAVAVYEDVVVSPGPPPTPGNSIFLPLVER